MGIKQEPTMIKQINLDENVYSYREAKDQRLFIYWRGQQIMTLKGKAATKLSAQLAGSSYAKQQLALAKVTGNFKRGNEREGKSNH